jgi:hypothetical protein
MPSKSKQQHKFMATVAHNPKFAKTVGVPTKIGEDYMKADAKGKKKFGNGGMMPSAPAGGMDTQKAAMMKALMADPQKLAALKAMMAGQGVGAPAMKRGGKVKKPAKPMGMKDMKGKKDMKDMKGMDAMKDMKYKKSGAKKMMGGGMTKAYKEGGEVRGYGMARGSKSCKMR